MHNYSAIDSMPELKKNILNFGYGANFKHEGMLSHSFDRFYVVIKFEIPKVQDLKITSFSFDLMCNYLNITNAYMLRYIKHCKRIVPYNRQKRFIATILGSMMTSVIGLALEGISSFLHYKRHKTLLRRVYMIDKRVDMQHNVVYHLEDIMIM